jgi:serine/threonine-protein kinase
MQPGTYQVRVDYGANYAPWMTQISVTQGQVVSLPPAVLALRAVTVDFTSDPSGAEVTLIRGSERRSIGRTPVAADVDVMGGAWTVRMERAGHEDHESLLVLPAGESRGAHTANLTRSEVRRVASGSPNRAASTSTQETESVSAAPTPVSTASVEPRASGGAGTLRINTRPWSQVFVDGRLIGNTPQMSISLPAGRHTVTLVNSDFDIRETITVEIAAGETTTRVLTLQPGG